jgi:hypothetical protein
VVAVDDGEGDDKPVGTEVPDDCVATGSGDDERDERCSDSADVGVLAAGVGLPVPAKGGELGGEACNGLEAVCELGVVPPAPVVEGGLAVGGACTGVGLAVGEVCTGDGVVGTLAVAPPVFGPDGGLAGELCDGVEVVEGGFCGGEGVAVSVWECGEDDEVDEAQLV